MSIRMIAKMVATCAVAVLSVSCTLSINGQKMEVVKGKGECLTREYDLSGFDAIRVSGCYDVRFVQTEGEYAVSVETFENIFDLISVRVEDGTLVLGHQGDKPFRTDFLKVLVKGPALKSVYIEGSADLDMNSFKSADNLEIQVFGAGDFRLDDISCDAFEVEVNGAGDLNVKGLCCSRSAVTVNGAGDVDLQFVAAPEVEVSVNGAGDVRLSGTAGKVSCSISGAGSVDARTLTYEQFDGHKAGVGSIRK